MKLADDLLVGAKAAAEYTGLPQSAIYKYVEKGELPVKRVGASLFFRKSELETYFRADPPAGEA